MRLLLGEAPLVYARFYEIFEKLQPAPEVAARAVVIEIVFKHRDVVFAEKARRAVCVFFLIYAVRLFVVFHYETFASVQLFYAVGILYDGKANVINMKFLQKKTKVTDYSGR